MTTWPFAVGFMASLIIPSHSANFLEAFKSLHHLGKRWDTGDLATFGRYPFPSLSSRQWNLTDSPSKLLISGDFKGLWNTVKETIYSPPSWRQWGCRFELRCSSSSFDEDIPAQYRRNSSSSPSTVLAAPQWIFGEIQVNEDADFHAGSWRQRRRSWRTSSSQTLR